MRRKPHIKAVHTFNKANVKNTGPGKRPVIRRVRPDDGRFAVGNVFWLVGDGLYELMELTKP